MDGKPEFEQYESSMARLSAAQREEVLELVASHDPSGYAAAAALHPDSQVRQVVLDHYRPLSKDAERDIWDRVRAARSTADSESVPDDVLVEDAGLYDDEVIPGNGPSGREVQGSVNLSKTRSHSVAAELSVGGVR